LGARTRKQPELHAGAVAGAAASSLATVVQLAFVIGLVSPRLLEAMLIPLAAAGLAALSYAALFTLRSVRETGEREQPAGRPFNPTTAIVFVLVVGATLLLSALLTEWLGDRGLLLASGLAGLSDAHAAAISAATLGQTERVSAEHAVLAILIGFSTNALSKCVVALSMGSRQYALELLPGLALMVAGAWLGWYWTVR
jgi:uncharacterized membrane protein (DUF4010 family)